MAYRDITLRERVRRKAREIGYTMEEIATHAQIPPRTFYRRMDHPGELTLYEIHRLDAVVHFTDEEKLLLVDRRMA